MDLKLLLEELNQHFSAMTLKDIVLVQDDSGMLSDATACAIGLILYNSPVHDISCGIPECQYDGLPEASPVL